MPRRPAPRLRFPPPLRTRLLRTTLLAAGLALAAPGCSFLTDFDQFDAEGDDAEQPPPGASQTAGGAELSNGTYTLRVSVGAPTPAETVRGGGYVLRAGPRVR